MIRFYFLLLICMALVIMSCKNGGSSNAVWSVDRIPFLKSRADKFYDSNDYAQAMKYYDTLILIDSLNGEFYFKRGYSNSQVFKYIESVNDYLRAIALGYRKSSAYFNLGSIYAIVDDSIAITYFEKCLAEDPEHPKARKEIEESKTRIQGKLR